MHEVSHKIIINGEIKSFSEPVLAIDNRGYRYGDGVFETMTLMRGQILHETAHFARLFSALQTLEVKIPGDWMRSYFTPLITNLCEINHLVNARVRLTVYRGNGFLDALSIMPGFTIEATPLTKDAYLYDGTGIEVGIFYDSLKSCDKYSCLKSANYLSSVMGSIFASKNQLADAILLNCQGRVCESSVANLFVVKDGQILTPFLSEGPVAGIIRQYILLKADILDYEIIETEIDTGLLMSADEVFLTNAIHPVRPVTSISGHRFGNKISEHVYRRLFEPFL